MSPTIRKTKKSQILVAMVILMFLSLSLGISIAGGFITNIKVQTQADELSKAQAAAEALMEKMLLIPSTTLEGYINSNNCGSACTWQVTDTTGKIISASATLSFAGNSTSSFNTNLETTSIFQLNLKGYTSGKKVDVCWNTLASVYASYIKQTTLGVVSSQAYAYNSANTAYPDNGLPTTSSDHGYTNCFTVTATETPIMLRLKSYYLNTPVFFFPESGQSIPKQGVLITSIGKSGTATRKVIVLKTAGALPGVFDYVIYQRSSSAPLSNVTL